MTPSPTTCLPLREGASASDWPDHLTTPSAQGWTWWRDAVLRGAGFPASIVRLLQDPDAARAADRASAAEAAREQAYTEAERCVHDQVTAWRASARGTDGAAASRRWRRAQKLLRRREADPELAAVLPAALFERLRATATQATEAMQASDEAYAAALVRLRDACATLASDTQFRAAVAWQNHSAVSVVLDALAAGADAGGSKQRQREALVANYAQRYGVKNDTIGFFGPMAWMRLAPAGSAPRFVVGEQLVRSRSVHFEDWPIATLAEALATDDRFLPTLVPHLQPFLRLEGQRLRLPGGANVELSASEALLLGACDGRRSVAEIATALGANPFSPMADRAAVLALVRRLEDQQRLHLAFRVPSCQDDPERALRAHLLEVKDAGARAEALARLDALVDARARVAGASGDSQALPLAMAALDETFSGLTGSKARRRGGVVYGGRGLVYEDCHRDVDFVLDEHAIAPLREALDLVMTSARWLTGEVAARYRDCFDARFDELAAAGDGQEVAFPDLWLRLQSLLFGDEVPLDDLAQALRERWEALLDPFGPPEAPGVERRIERSVEDLRPAVAAAFPATAAGWNLARYQCPDVMFCAADPQALLEGRYLAVLGEVHLGGNTVMTNLFASQHPDRAALLRGARADLGERYVVPKLSPEASHTPIRTQMLDDPQAAVEILFSRGLVPACAETAVRSGDLNVRRENGRLVVRHRERAWSAELMDALGDFLFLATINQFGILRKRPHTPRVTLGRLVVQRESWTIAAQELAATLDADDAASFRRLRAFVAARGVPAATFAKVAWEAKPFLVDFDSPVSVRSFARQVRHFLEEGGDPAERVTLSEMLPAFDELWLRDREGRTYTSELRLVALHRDDLGR